MYGLLYLVCDLRGVLVQKGKVQMEESDGNLYTVFKLLPSLLLELIILLQYHIKVKQFTVRWKSLEKTV